jgi:hypothetical protein
VKNLNFSQTIRFRCTDPEKLVQMAAEWDSLQAEMDLMGYMGSHILADRENPGLYLMIAEFGVVDPNVSAAEEAMKNNDREQTQEWAAKLLEIVEGEIEWGNFDEIYRTG